MTFKNHQKEAEILDLTRGRIEDVSPKNCLKKSGGKINGDRNKK